MKPVWVMDCLYAICVWMRNSGINISEERTPWQWQVYIRDMIADGAIPDNAGQVFRNMTGSTVQRALKLFMMEAPDLVNMVHDEDGREVYVLYSAPAR